MNLSDKNCVHNLFMVVSANICSKWLFDFYLVHNSIILKICCYWRLCVASASLYQTLNFPSIPVSHTLPTFQRGSVLILKADPTTISIYFLNDWIWMTSLKLINVNLIDNMTDFDASSRTTNNLTISLKIVTKVVITWSWFPGIKLQLIQREKISPYDYMGESNFISVRRHSFPRGIYLGLYTSSFNFPL